MKILLSAFILLCLSISSFAQQDDEPYTNKVSIVQPDRVRVVGDISITREGVRANVERYNEATGTVIPWERGSEKYNVVISIQQFLNATDNTNTPAAFMRKINKRLAKEGAK